MTIDAHLLSRLRRIDWDFPGSPSESPFSAIHWHPARFASQVPSSLIGLLSRPGDLVLDPFMGSGTTLVEAQRLGRRPIGIDLNPIACKIVRAKTLSVSLQHIERAIKAIYIESQGLRKLFSGRKSRPKLPDSVQRMWYTDRVLDDLHLLWGQISSYRGTKRVIAEAAFSAILLPVCRETRHWGYVCDNSTPKGSYERDVVPEYHSVLERLSFAYAERETDRIATRGAHAKVPTADIYCGDARDILSAEVSPGSVDLVVTSPPYFGVSDYIKSQRLSMEWFGTDIEPFRLREIGARSKRHRGSAPEEYVRELGTVFTAVGRCLRKGGLCVVIVGESSKRDSLLLRVLGQLLLCGLKQELDLNRHVSSLRRQLPSITSEHLLVMSK